MGVGGWACSGKELTIAQPSGGYGSDGVVVHMRYSDTG